MSKFITPTIKMVSCFSLSYILTTCSYSLPVLNDITLSLFILARFNGMLACKDSYYVVVLEDTSCSQVIGAATLAVEQKFIRNCSSVSVKRQFTFI